jgi:NhaP-type Na+/H+ or K+/H+ antiporter
MSGIFSSSALGVAALGTVVLLTAWLPLLLKGLPLSLPVIAVGFGYFAIAPLWPAGSAQSAVDLHVIEHMTEFVVLIALMGAGLRIGRPFSWRAWAPTWLMLGVAMPLTIGATALLGWAVMGLPAASAILIGAVLAPTDPVLAADVQAKPPGEGEGGEVRFVLTSEAGLNDGAAFPFVVLAIGITTASFNSLWADWIVQDLVLRLFAGVAVGFLSGRAFGWLTFKLPSVELSKTGDGLVAVGVTLISYGIAETIHGYGFVAVFVAAMTLRASDRGHDFHAAMAEFSEQIERILMVLIMVTFGAALGWGLLGPLEWRDIVGGVILLIVIRPLAGWISLRPTTLPAAARGLIAFFGIRGLGTFYYMAYAVGRGEFDGDKRLWAITSFIVLCSVVLHGTTAVPVMNWVDRKRAETSKISPN